MKNKEKWKPSKFEFKNGKLRASRNPKEVSISSRLNADLIAAIYQANLSNYAKGKLLDLGCGNVPFYEAYKPFITENICVDWGNSMHENNYLDYTADLNLPINLEDAQFDTIILSDVLEHIREPNLLLKEISRLLKNDGNLIMNVPFLYWLHEEPFDYFRYTKHALISMLNEAGLETIKIEPFGGSPAVVTDILAKTFTSIPFVGNGLSKIIQTITSQFLKLDLGQKVAAKTAERFPLGYFVVAKKHHT